MYTLGSNLKKLRVSRKITQEQFANALNERFLTKINKSMVSKWENDKEVPRLDFIRFAASYYNESLDTLLGIKKSHRTRIPVLGKVQAGIPIEAVQDIIDEEDIDPKMALSGDFFALKIKGNSMEPRIYDGDVVIVRRQPDVESGQIAVILIDGKDATVKIVEKHEDGIVLIGLNTSVYPPHLYTNKQIEELPITILGKVVELRGKFE